MKFGIKLPHSGPLASPKAIRTIALEAEKLGFHSVWVHDHISYGKDWIGHRASGLAESISESYEPVFYESFGTLCYVSALTHRVGLGTAVLALPLRNPLVLGRQLITLQSLSDNRLTVGVAAGDYPAEFRALGIPYSERGKITDEYLDVLRVITEGGKVSYHGKYLNFDEAHFYPRIVSGTKNSTILGYKDLAIENIVNKEIPFIIGGGVIASKDPKNDSLVINVLKRVARAGDGWMPDWGDPEIIGRGIRMIKEYSKTYNRSVDFKFGLSTALYLSDSSEDAIGRTSRTIKGSELESNTVAGIGNRTPERIYDKSLIGSRPLIVNKIEQYSKSGVELFQMTCLAENLESFLLMIKKFSDEVTSSFE